MPNPTFTVNLVDGNKPQVTKTVLGMDGNSVNSSALVPGLIQSRDYKCSIFEKNLVCIFHPYYGPKVFIINSNYSCMPITSEDIVFLRNILQDVKRFLSPNRGNCSKLMNIKWGGIQKQVPTQGSTGFVLKIKRKILHVNPVTEEKRKLFIRIFPQVHHSLTKKGNLSGYTRKVYLPGNEVEISERTKI
jgi:hypothetical protein